MNLLLDIGNTRVKWARAEGPDLTATGSLVHRDNPDWPASLPDEPPAAIWVANVADETVPAALAKGGVSRIPGPGLHTGGSGVAGTLGTQEYEIAPFLNLGLQRGGWELVGWLIFEIPFHQEAQEEVDVEKRTVIGGWILKANGAVTRRLVWNKDNKKMYRVRPQPAPKK
jgi:hypothetical protein